MEKQFGKTAFSTLEYFLRKVQSSGMRPFEKLQSKTSRFNVFSGEKLSFNVGSFSKARTLDKPDSISVFGLFMNTFNPSLTCRDLQKYTEEKRQFWRESHVEKNRNASELSQTFKISSIFSILKTCVLLYALLTVQSFIGGAHLANAAFSDGRAEESEFEAIRYTAAELETWLGSISARPESIGIFQVNVQAPLMSDLAEVLEAEATQTLKRIPNLKVVSCLECRAPQVTVKGDRLLIKQGLIDPALLQQMAKKIEVESFLNLSVFRTKLAVITQASVYQAASGDLLYTRQIYAPSLMTDSSLTLSLAGGMGFVFGERIKTDRKTPPFAASFDMFQKTNFGKAGLSAGTFTAGSKGTAAYFTSSLGWPGRYQGTSLTSLTGLGVGYAALSGGYRGLALRGIYDLYVGTYTLIGIEILGIAPLGTKRSQYPYAKGYIGVRIGFVLGR